MKLLLEYNWVVSSSSPLKKQPNRKPGFFFHHCSSVIRDDQAMIRWQRPKVIRQCPTTGKPVDVREGSERVPFIKNLQGFKHAAI